MPSEAIYTLTEPHLRPILAELVLLEPIFHTREFASTQAEFELRMAPNYWEVGASGIRYTRESILAMLAESAPVDSLTVGWQTSDHALQQLGSATYLLTYTLDQQPRVTRRATIWQATLHGWQILYHQGTVIAADADDPGPTS